MTLHKQLALDAIEKEQNTILHVADEIWDYAELSLQEFRSAKLYCEVLKQEGFRVEEGVCGIATAFAASFGSGRPHIGILAEYDALSGLSQQGGQLVHAERTPGGTGHGCGHNLLGAGALAAAIGVKAWLEQTGCPGTVTLYGCPATASGSSSTPRSPGTRRTATRSSPAARTPASRCSTPSTASPPTRRARRSWAGARWTRSSS